MKNPTPVTTETITSEMESKYKATTGLYYFQQDLLYIEERTLFSGTILPSPPFPAGTPLNLVRTGGGYGEFSTFGAFASADWHLNEQITLNFGLRYTKEEKDAIVSRIRWPRGGTGGESADRGTGYITGPKFIP